MVTVSGFLSEVSGAGLRVASFSGSMRLAICASLVHHGLGCIFLPGCLRNRVYRVSFCGAGFPDAAIAIRKRKSRVSLRQGSIRVRVALPLKLEELWQPIALWLRGADPRLRFS